MGNPPRPQRSGGSPGTEEHREGWHIGGQPFFGPPTLMSTLGRTKAAYEAIDGTPTTREDLATQAPVRHR
jgi:4-oxalocrotonate tautomerase